MNRLKEALFELIPGFMLDGEGALSEVGLTYLVGGCAVLFLIAGLFVGAVIYRFGRRAVVEVAKENNKLAQGLEMYRATVEKQTRVNMFPEESRGFFEEWSDA